MISPGETVVVPTQVTLDYVPFSTALEHKFGSLKKRELKRTGTVLWGALGELCLRHEKTSLYSEPDSCLVTPPTALFAAQRDAVSAPVTTPQTVEVDPTALSSMAKKLLPDIGVSADLLPAEEIECVPDDLLRPFIRLPDRSHFAYFEQTHRNTSICRVCPDVRHRRRDSRTGCPERGRWQGGAGAELPRSRRADGTGTSVGPRRVTLRSIYVDEVFARLKHLSLHCRSRENTLARRFPSRVRG